MEIGISAGSLMDEYFKYRWAYEQLNEAVCLSLLINKESLTAEQIRAIIYPAWEKTQGYLERR